MKYDVIIIGFGPTGKVLARKLSDCGHTVAIVERWPNAYPLPRAVGFDHEIMRIFHALGVNQAVDAISRPMNRYVWYNADWKVLLDLDQSAETISGGPMGYLFNQPDLERLLEHDLQGRPGITLFTGHEARAVRDLGGHVEVDLLPYPLDQAASETQTTTLTGRFLVGCDGANSLVRESMGSSHLDLGFDESWIVVDICPKTPLDIPDAAQWCNPARPMTIIGGGRTNRRWEFMLLPGETPEDFATEEQIWPILARWVAPGEAELIRKASYRFRSLIAKGWRKGRLLIAGDAAHRTPPFLGQGMGAGLRDSWNLAWKLDRVLRGLSPDALLDSYEAERSPHIEAIIRTTIELGKVVCVTNPQAAQARDEAFFAGKVPPPPDFPGLLGGVIAAEDGGCASCAGVLTPHDELQLDRGTVRLDQLTRYGFSLISRSVVNDPRLADLGIVAISLDGLQRDVHGRLEAFLDRFGVEAVLVRPDFYAFGAVQKREDIPALLDQLEAKLARAA